MEPDGPDWSDFDQLRERIRNQDEKLESWWDIMAQRVDRLTWRVVIGFSLVGAVLGGIAIHQWLSRRTYESIDKPDPTGEDQPAETDDEGRLAPSASGCCPF